MNDPIQITLTQVQQALQALGISPDLRNLRSVTIDLDTVTVVRARVNEEGRSVVIPWANRLAEISTEIPLVKE